MRPNYLFFLNSLEGLGRRRSAEHLWCACYMLLVSSWAHRTYGFQPCFFNTVGNDSFSVFEWLCRAMPSSIMRIWASLIPLIPCSQDTELLSKCWESNQVSERRNVHLHMSMLWGLGFCTYLCPWSTGTANQNPFPVHLSTFASFDHSFLSPPVSSTHTFPVSFVSLCLNGSVFQCSGFFLHLSFAYYSKFSFSDSKPSSLSLPYWFQWFGQWCQHVPTQPSWKLSGHCRSLLPNIQLVFNERLLLFDSLSPCFPIAPIPGLD